LSSSTSSVISNPSTEKLPDQLLRISLIESILQLQLLSGV
jgi:hypothetical protein